MTQASGSGSPAPSSNSATIESVLQEQRLFAPPAELAAQARIGSMQVYRDLVAQARTDPDGFWGDQARSQLHWFEPFHTVLDWSNPPFARWFEGGTTTLSYTCLDRHL
ncbi:MAG: acetyl-coenzyme A synthetase N-terminal domain-containing protein, partial [Cyanobacteriota bacterium]